LTRGSEGELGSPEHPWREGPGTLPGFPENKTRGSEGELGSPEHPWREGPGTLPGFPENKTPPLR
jgi:hypothetical protein